MDSILGRTGIKLSSLGLGCWPIGGAMFFQGLYDGYSRIDDDESIRALHAAFHEGVTFYDTADVYGAGHSERILGKAFSSQRDKVVLATKFGFGFNESTKWIYGEELRSEYIKLAAEASLKRLNTDYIDLYQLHCHPENPEVILSVVDCLESLVREGKIRSYGWSTDSVDAAKTFAVKKGCSAIQFEMNIFTDGSPMADFTRSESLSGIIRTPLAMGLLSGKYSSQSTLPEKDVRSSPFDWMKFFNHGRPREEYLKKLERIQDILRSGGRTMVQGALAYLWGRYHHIIPIPGFRTEAQAVENARAMQLGPLPEEAVKEIDEITERSGVE